MNITLNFKDSRLAMTRNPQGLKSTQEKQQQLYDDKVAGYRKEGNSQSEAEELAKQWVSVPGYSEHQIGLAVDINGAIYDLAARKQLQIRFYLPLPWR